MKEALEPQKEKFDDIALILQCHSQLQKIQNETNDQFIARVDDFVQKNQHLKDKDKQFYIKNHKQIHQALSNRLERKGILVSIGHVAKWAKSIYSAMSAALAKSGVQATGTGWAQLMKATIQYGTENGTKALMKNTLQRTLKSQTTWISAGIVFAFDVGCEFYKWHCGKLTGKQFWINVGKNFLTNLAGVGGGIGGAAIGVGIGTLLGGPVVGLIVGSIIGALTASTLTSIAVDKLQEMFNSPKKLYLKALKFFDLPQDFKFTNLQAARKFCYQQNHPDKWLESSKQTQQNRAKKIIESTQYYQIIIKYKQHQQ